MKQIYANNLTTLSLGRQGENLARQVVFDIRDLESLYGSGTVEVIHQRPGDAQPYPLAVQRDGTLVTWNVTATDTEMSAATANERYGKCELRYYAGETLAKSQIWRTWVESAMDTPSETAPPEPEQGWVDQVLAVGVSVKEATDSAKTYANSAEQSASGAAQSAQEAAGSASAASTSATNAKASEESAAESASAAANSAASASAAASAASGSASAAKASETAAKASEEAAKASETAAKASETAAAESASAAQQSATSAAESAAVYDAVVSDVNQLKQDISNMRFGDPYPGEDLTVVFAGELEGYTDPGAWIRARIRANNFDGIHVNDYIPFTTTNGLKFKARVAGIDPYYEYGDHAIGHHIDFICEELWPTLKPINPVKYNNGLIPTENVTSDGTATQYVLTKPMYGVEKVTLSGTDLTGWIYDKDTYTLTFSTAPAAGTMVVTGTGSEYPWLSCDAYLYANSLAGHVANSTGLNPAIKRVDYTNDGIYHYLPDWLKAVIIEKRFLLNKRYSATGILSDENGWGWTNIGKIWFPTEVEVYGCPVWGSKGGYGLGGSIQYPYFVGNMRRLKKRNGGRAHWWLLSPYTNTSYWCCVNSYGIAYHYNTSSDWIAAPVCFRIG